MFSDGTPVTPEDVIYSYTRATDPDGLYIAFLNMITGVVWAIGNVLIFISCANPNIGQAVATTFSQLNVIVAVLGGILILHEKRTRRQLWFIALGTLLIAAGAVLMGNLGVL